ncbi:MAG TPA: WecB/TagA/CpsF family glycosyltransferase [Candidatus Dormibacteraeota bacterium]
MRVLGVRVDCVDMEAAVARIAEMIESGAPCRLVATVNPEFVMHARRDAEFAAILETAELAVIDGSGVLWAARRQGCAVGDKVAGIDLVLRLAELCAARGWRPFLLGAQPGVAEAAAARLAERYPGFQAAGAYAGEPGPAGDAEALKRIEAARPDLLLVAYGHSRQERWIARNRELLPVPVAIGVGGAFDFASGRIRRAPGWMRRVHLEWLFRLALQPWRARRMAVLPKFALAVLRDR